MAHTEPMNQGVEDTKLRPQTKFFDDNIMAEVRYLIHQAAEDSVFTASVFMGNSNLVKETISIFFNASSLTSMKTWGSSQTPGQ